jgi:hypothetical protein
MVVLLSWTKVFCHEEVRNRKNPNSPLCLTFSSGLSILNPIERRVVILHGKASPDLSGSPSLERTYSGI